MERGPIVYLIAVGVVMGICAALFRPVEDIFLPQAVPADQLSVAVALNAARGSVAQLSGTAAGGSLFAVARFVPFLAYAVACFLVLFLRVPPREVRSAPTRHLRREIMVGLRWVSAHRHIRVTALCAIVLNLFIRTSSSSCWPKAGKYARGRSARAVRCQSGPPDHGETAVERRLRLVAGDAVLQSDFVRLDDPRQRVSSEWILPTPFAESVR
jgi:MFS family permease